MVKLDDCVVRPQYAAHFLPGDHLTGMVKQHLEDLEWLLLKARRLTVAVQFARTNVQLERAKTG